jgi:hypothetical protein
MLCSLSLIFQLENMFLHNNITSLINDRMLSTDTQKGLSNAGLNGHRFTRFSFFSSFDTLGMFDEFISLMLVSVVLVYSYLRRACVVIRCLRVTVRCDTEMILQALLILNVMIDARRVTHPSFHHISILLQVLII